MGNPARATVTLRHMWARGWHAAAYPAPQVASVAVVRYHPGSRCALRIACPNWPDGGAYVKITAQHARHAGRVERALAAAGFGAGSAFRVPTVIAAAPELGVTALSPAAGVSLKRLAGDDLGAAAAMTARWLAAFAGAAIPLPSAFAWRDPVARARRWGARVTRTAPEVADLVRRLVEGIAAQYQSPGPLRLIHGDFTAEHVFWAPTTLTVIDWESARVGDPAEDAGRFLASIADRVIRGRFTAMDGMAASDAFRRAYALALPPSAGRLPVCTALACLRKASHARLRDPERAARLLWAGLDAIDRI